MMPPSPRPYGERVGVRGGRKRREQVSAPHPNPLPVKNGERGIPYFQNCRVAMRAPSAIAASLAQTTSGSTAAWPTQVP